MAKGKKVTRPPEQDGPNDEVTIKVYRSERPLVNRVAGARGETVAELFRSVEMRTFLTHLLVAAGEQEKQRLEGQEPEPK